ncbi:MAG: hypothetical protein OER92_03840 [Alphaproteobacteria bacterium]|nr:hypothetical protein [Alphaproteobacteria bacterium]
MDNAFEHNGVIDLAAEYFRDEGLAELLASSQAADTNGYSVAIEPDVDDLVRLHQLVRERRAFTVLEFGTGYSTLVIADALAKNADDFASSDAEVELLPADAFRVFSVDASEAWLATAMARIPSGLQTHVVASHSPVRVGTHNGQLCHFYERLPNMVPDFIYLDGPDPRDVQGTVNGLDFSHRERTVMSGDLLLMEPTFVPGLLVLVDGRTNNARFLANNFRRTYDWLEDPGGDFTMFELAEPPLGHKNRARLAYCAGEDD